MARIEQLTAEQAAYLPKFRDEYFRHGTNCEPADRPRAERAFERAYKSIGREPVPVIWVDSPITAQLAFAALKNLQIAGAEGAGSDSLWASLGGSLWASKIEINHTYWWGQQDLYWIAFYKFCREVGVQYQPEAAEKLEIMHEIAMSCMWWYPRDGLIIACERPRSVSFDSRERLHNETGPAVEFRDGWKIYAVHGVRLDGWIIEQPDLLTIKGIEAETNTEVQRVMIERFGWDRYAAECGAKVIDHDDRWGTLFGRNDSAEFLKVVNGSPEPDGTFRNYILPVAPQCEPLPDEDNTTLGEPQRLTALNAVASTYGMTGKEYARVMEVRT